MKNQKTKRTKRTRKVSKSTNALIRALRRYVNGGCKGEFIIAGNGAFIADPKDVSTDGLLDARIRKGAKLRRA